MVSKEVIHSKYHAAEEFSRILPSRCPFQEPADSLGVSLPPARVAGTQRPPPPPQDGRSTRAEQCCTERATTAGKSLHVLAGLPKPRDRPVAGTQTTLQPLQPPEGNLGSRHLL